MQRSYAGSHRVDCGNSGNSLDELVLRANEDPRYPAGVPPSNFFPHRPASPRIYVTSPRLRHEVKLDLDLIQVMSGSLTVVAHPLVNAKLSVLRKSETTPKEFREVCILAPCAPHSQAKYRA